MQQTRLCRTKQRGDGVKSDLKIFFLASLCFLGSPKIQHHLGSEKMCSQERQRLSDCTSGSAPSESFQPFFLPLFEETPVLMPSPKGWERAGKEPSTGHTLPSWKCWVWSHGDRVGSEGKAAATRTRTLPAVLPSQPAPGISLLKLFQPPLFPKHGSEPSRSHPSLWEALFPLGMLLLWPSTPSPPQIPHYLLCCRYPDSSRRDFRGKDRKSFCTCCFHDSSRFFWISVNACSPQKKPREREKNRKCMNILLDKASRDVHVGVWVKKSSWSKRWGELSPIRKSRGKYWSFFRIYSSQVEKMLWQHSLCPRVTAQLCLKAANSFWQSRGLTVDPDGW